MRSQIVIGEVLNILIMLFIISGIFAIFSSIEYKYDKYTSQKKMELILDKVDYESKEICYESKIFNSTIERWINLPNTINLHKYQLMGNGTELSISCNGMVLKKRENIMGMSFGGNIKLECKNNEIRIV